MSREFAMDVHEVLRYLPHRYPFMLIDRVLECQPGEWLTALKNVTYNEPFFMGHFPQRPVMPGVLIVEAMAQATGLLAMCTDQAQLDSGSLYYLAGIDNARFKRPVEPGDQLVIRAERIRITRGVGKFAVESTVDGDLAARAEVMAALRAA